MFSEYTLDIIQIKAFEGFGLVCAMRRGLHYHFARLATNGRRLPFACGRKMHLLLNLHT